jgi:hypothetical protein
VRESDTSTEELEDEWIVIRSKKIAWRLAGNQNIHESVEY